LYLNHSNAWQGKKIEIDNLKHCIYCRVIDPCLVVRIPQQKALHLTGIYLDHSTTEQGKKKSKQYTYNKVINQCQTVRIPQQNVSHLTGIYLDHRTAEQGKKEIYILKHCTYCKVINQYA
jgi:hypothetical protein